MQKHARRIYSSYVATLYDEIIEEMLADADGRGEVDPRDAVELAELFTRVNIARHAEGRPPFTLPSMVQRALVWTRHWG